MLCISIFISLGLLWWLRGQSVCLQCGRPGFDPWVGKTPWKKKWQPTPVLLPGESHGGRILVGYSPRGCKELDTTEWLHFHFIHIFSSVQSSSAQSHSRVRLFVTPWIAACQASLSITNSRSSLRFMSIESVMPSSHLILSSPSPPAPNPSQHQSLFQWVNSSHEVAKVQEFQL